MLVHIHWQVICPMKIITLYGLPSSGGRIVILLENGPLPTPVCAATATMYKEYGCSPTSATLRAEVLYC